jgi:hypothetical protein
MLSSIVLAESVALSAENFENVYRNPHCKKPKIGNEILHLHRIKKRLKTSSNAERSKNQG